MFKFWVCVIVGSGNKILQRVMLVFFFTACQVNVFTKHHQNSFVTVLQFLQPMINKAEGNLYKSRKASFNTIFPVEHR